MVCGPEGQRAVRTAVGLPATEVSTPTWVDHLYSCDYRYGGDTAIGLSVKDLASTSDTDAWFDRQARELGRGQDLVGIGDAAFATSGGDLVARKDDTVLHVDVSRLPAEFGTPSAARSDVAINVAAAIMSCWTGQ
mgnify:FL=1